MLGRGSWPFRHGPARVLTRGEVAVAQKMMRDRDRRRGDQVGPWRVTRKDFSHTGPVPAGLLEVVG